MLLVVVGLVFASSLASADCAFQGETFYRGQYVLKKIEALPCPCTGKPKRMAKHGCLVQAEAQGVVPGKFKNISVRVSDPELCHKKKGLKAEAHVFLRCNDTGGPVELECSAVTAENCLREARFENGERFSFRLIEKPSKK